MIINRKPNIPPIMVLFNKIPENLGQTKNTKGFYFGHTEAEGEIKAGIQNLDHYFFDYLDILPKLANEKFLLIGRKGSGKSAIAKSLKDASDKENDSYADLIKYNDIELEAIIQKIPDNEKENIETFIFEWLILVRLIKLFLKNPEGSTIPEYKKLKAFLDRNTGFIEIDKYHITEIIEKKNFQVAIGVLKHIFEPIISRYVDVKKTHATFYQFVNPLKEIIKKIIQFPIYKEREYLIMFDDLDIKFKADDKSSKEKLLSLIRVAKYFNTTIFRNTNTKVLIFLRDDIRNALETWDSDTSKIFSSYSITLDWYDHENFKSDENNVKLKQFINKRISLNFEANNITYNKHNPWKSLFQEDIDAYGDKTSFKHLIDYTFYRPRDLILFFSEIGNNSYSYPLSQKNVKILITKFISANIIELKSELKIHFDDESITKLFGSLKQISSLSNISKEDCLSIFEKNIPNYSSSYILELMLEYSVLIFKNKDRLFFNYRENNLESANFHMWHLTMHKAVFKYFNPDKY